MDLLATAGIGNPLRVTFTRGHLAVEALRRLEEHPRLAAASVLAKALILEPRSLREITGGDLHINSLIAKDPKPAAVGLVARVVASYNDAADARREDCVGAGRP